MMGDDMSSFQHAFRFLWLWALPCGCLALAIPIKNAASAQIPSPAAQPAVAGAATSRLFADSKIKADPRFVVEVTGHGPDLIFISGLACSREVWHQTADRLRKKYTLHLIQTAGFGGEPARDNANGPVLDPTMEAVDAYIVSNKLAPATVIGHSFGGTMAMRLAQQHPADVKKILMVDALPFFGVLVGGAHATSDSMKAGAAAYQKELAAPPSDESRARSRTALAGMVTAPANVDLALKWTTASDRNVVGQAAYDDMTLDMRAGLQAMTTPVTLIYPYDAKRGIPLQAWDGLYHAEFEPLQHKTLVRVDDSKHFIMYDQPEKFAAALDDFLQH
jgi:pimeloyl-[acyl-carrier protein] methyl ester esterase